MKKVFGFFIALGICVNSYAIDLQSAAKEALKEHKLILLSVERENCHYCEKMSKEVFAKKQLMDSIGQEYVHEIVITNANTKLPSNLKVQYFPTNFILNPKDLSIVDEFDGYMSAKDFLDLLKMEYEQEIKG